MNIKQAKEQIQNAVKAYFTKDPFGNYIIPVERQRPVFLLGPPGIGKTAIMEQIAQELGVGLVSYSMTHHTRQSALGLPFIEKRVYNGQEYAVSEYTMSEIIASVYDMMEKTDIKEGILFLDEINCVSETLAPAMLQFLQYKIFGNHRVPDGWIVVTAGNPPEYNHSVREFDIVTWDRLKRIDVEPDYPVWKEYAFQRGIHPAVTTYLDIKKSDFYKIETTVDGKCFVTARGWSDLSDMMKLCEQQGINIDQNLIGQYLQNKKIAKEFAIYYDLFNKYKSDYQIDQILDEKGSETIRDRAKHAKFDERLMLLGLLLNVVTEEMKMIFLTEQTLTELMNCLKIVRTELEHIKTNLTAPIQKQTTIFQKKIQIGKQASSLSSDTKYIYHNVIAILEQMLDLQKKRSLHNNCEVYTLYKNEFDMQVRKLQTSSCTVKKHLSNLFSFCEAVFGNGQEILILVTELTANYYSAHFISRYGCKEYFEHNKELLFYERQKEIITELEALDLND